MRYWVALLVCAFSSAGLQAKWIEVSSAHFVIYADDDATALRRYAEKLESFHAAMALITNAKSPSPTPANRVTIFIIKSGRAVRKLLGDDDQKFVQAFYVPRVEGSIALVPEIGTDHVIGVDFAMLPLLHEYAHHFTISLSDFPQPRWLGEGSAEFYSSASFQRNGTVELGKPAVHRGYELFNARDVTVEGLFDPAAYEKKRKTNIYDAFYGKSWLLYHYLVSTDKRPGQLARYMKELSSGTEQVEAAKLAFGDFKLLEKELDAYQRSRGMMMIRVAKEAITIGEIKLRDLTKGEAEIMPVRVRSKRGVSREQAVTLLGDARAIAARYPEDPAVLTALAEAEYDAGNDAEAIAAADAALKRDPGQANAYVQKGYALFRSAYAATDRAAAYRKAVQPFLALNKIENDHPIPLLFFYLSFSRQDKVPNENAVAALQQAMGLAPFDERLRQIWVAQLLRDGRLPEARYALVPLAYSPHGGPLAEQARQMIAQIDANEPPQMALLDYFSGQPNRGEAGDEAAAPAN